MRNLTTVIFEVFQPHGWVLKMISTQSSERNILEVATILAFYIDLILYAFYWVLSRPLERKGDIFSSLSYK